VLRAFEEQVARFGAQHDKRRNGRERDVERVHAHPVGAEQYALPQPHEVLADDTTRQLGKRNREDNDASADGVPPANPLACPAGVRGFPRRLFAPGSWGLVAESGTFAHLEHLRLADQAGSREAPDANLIDAAG
jgi:hypothetical protein